MICIQNPSDEQLRRFLHVEAERQFTYAEVGASRWETPGTGYTIDHTRIRLGSGQRDFEVARAALRSWRQFDLGWVAARPIDTDIRVDAAIAVVGRSFGLYWVNACKIIYLCGEEHGETVFGFAYGTLPAHVGAGEERFLVEMDDEGIVWYDILAFSRPHGLFGRLGYFHLRRLQRRFGRQSAARMQEIVGQASRSVPSTSL